MSVKKIAPLVVLGGLAYIATQGNKTPTAVAPPTNTDNSNTNINTGGGGLQTAGGSSGMIAVSGIQATSQPDYKTWTRAHWAAWSQSLLQNNSPEDTKTILWNAWRNGENPFADKFPSVDSLFFSLIAYRPDTAVGAFNIDENSLPVYDTWTAWYNNVDVWECADWKNWFDAMETAWSRTTAQQKFASAWSYADNWSLGSNGWSCSQTCGFIDDMTQRGVDVADTGMRTVCNLTNIPYNIVTAGSNVSQGINSATNAAANVAPFLIYGGAAFLAYKAYQTTKE